VISNKVKRGIKSKAAAISSPHLCPLNMLLRVRAVRVRVRAIRVRVRTVRADSRLGL
jgi:hypothetical protein